MDLELIVLAGLDTLCERYDINPVVVLELMIEEGLIDYGDLELFSIEEDL